MKKVFLLAALAVAAMTSCSKEDGNNETGTGTSSGKLISMRAVVDKTNNNNRAAGMSTERFNSFHVLAAKDMNGGLGTLDYLNTVVYSPYEQENVRNWRYSPRAYYPADGKSLSFFAYAPVGDRNMTPGSMQSSGYSAFFEYKVPFDQQNGLAEDLLVSCVPNSTSGTVVYTFDHALSAATFSADNPNGELVYVIKSIKITKLMNEGKFTYDEYGSGIGEWTNQSGGFDDYIAPILASGVAVTDGTCKLLNNNDFLIILPQKVENWSNENETSPMGAHVEVMFSVRDGNGNFLTEETRNFCIPYGTDLFDNGFEPGKCYNFNFTFDALNAITMDVNPVEDWSDDGNLGSLHPGSGVY